jgi:hypothetical protein
MALTHPLHLAIGSALATAVPADALYLDPACGGNLHLSLFVGDQPSASTHICDVDALAVVAGQVRVIVEIEESGVNPTKICGKFLTSALATHLVHGSLPSEAIPLGSAVLFVQVLDRAQLGPERGHKAEQARLLAERIDERLPLRRSAIGAYRLFLANDAADETAISSIVSCVEEAIR